MDIFITAISGRCGVTNNPSSPEWEVLLDPMWTYPGTAQGLGELTQNTQESSYLSSGWFFQLFVYPSLCTFFCLSLPISCWEARREIAIADFDFYSLLVVGEVFRARRLKLLAEAMSLWIICDYSDLMLFPFNAESWQFVANSYMVISGELFTSPFCDACTGMRWGPCVPW